MTLEAMCEHPAHRNVPCSIARCGQCDEQNAILRAAYKRHSESNSEHLERELASMTAARDYCLRTMNEAIEENTKLRSSTVEQLTKTWTGPTPTEGDLGPVEAAFLAHARRTWGTSTEMEEVEDSYFHFAAGYLAAQPSATRPISGIQLLKALREQRDEAADVLRRLMHKLREESGSENPMEPFAYDASWEALANEADATLAKCPSYEQQLRNIAEGIGMTVEELRAALNARADGTRA